MLDSSVENTNEAAVKLNVDFQFPAPVYTVEIPKFLPAVRKLSDKLLADKKRAVGVDKNHPMLYAVCGANCVEFVVRARVCYGQHGCCF